MSIKDIKYFERTLIVVVKVLYLRLVVPFAKFFANAFGGSHLFVAANAAGGHDGVFEPLLVGGPFAVDALNEIGCLCHDVTKPLKRRQKYEKTATEQNFFVILQPL